MKAGFTSAESKHYFHGSAVKQPQLGTFYKRGTGRLRISSPPLR
jgi:hypothetical protein